MIILVKINYIIKIVIKIMKEINLNLNQMKDYKLKAAMKKINQNLIHQKEKENNQ